MSHVRHQGNRSAHILAKHVKDMVNSDNFVTWIEENLSLMESAIAHDVITSHKKKCYYLLGLQLNCLN